VSVCLLLCILLHVPVEFEPAHLEQIAPVEHNPNVIASTWVIAGLDVGVDGHVRSATVVKGEEPLRSAVLASVRRWVLTPARTRTPVESRVTGVFLFRGRDIFSAPPPDLSGVSFAGPDRPPIPVRLSDPGYLVNSIAEGEVVLELRLSEAGSIQNVRVVKGIPALAEFTDQAVRSWRFAPALQMGQPVPGTVIVVVSYVRPV